MQLQSRRQKSPKTNSLKPESRTLPAGHRATWLQEATQPPQAHFLVERLDNLVREAGILGMAQHETVGAIMEWATKRSYAVGGYPRARSMMLEALETVLLAEATKSSA